MPLELNLGLIHRIPLRIPLIHAVTMPSLGGHLAPSGRLVPIRPGYLSDLRRRMVVLLLMLLLGMLLLDLRMLPWVIVIPNLLPRPPSLDVLELLVEGH